MSPGVYAMRVDYVYDLDRSRPLSTATRALGSRRSRAGRAPRAAVALPRSRPSHSRCFLL